MSHNQVTTPHPFNCFIAPLDTILGGIVSFQNHIVSGWTSQSTVPCQQMPRIFIRKHVWCRNPPPPSHHIPGRFLWAVPYPLMLRNSVEDVQAACELAHHSSNMVDRMLTESQRGAMWLRRDVQRELKYAEVEGAGMLWGTGPMAQPPVPRLVP